MSNFFFLHFWLVAITKPTQSVDHHFLADRLRRLRSCSCFTFRLILRLLVPFFPLSPLYFFFKIIVSKPTDFIRISSLPVIRLEGKEEKIVYTLYVFICYFSISFGFGRLVSSGFHLFFSLFSHFLLFFSFLFSGFVVLSTGQAAASLT